jgi:hypothetical protein
MVRISVLRGPPILWMGFHNPVGGDVDELAHFSALATVWPSKSASELEASTVGKKAVSSAHP